MELNDNTGELVTLTEAAEWTQNYRSTINSGDVTGHFFGKNKYNTILEQPGCIGVRTYYGIENGEKVLVLVGVDEQGNDMTNGAIVEQGAKCPPRCSEINALNS